MKRTFFFLIVVLLLSSVPLQAQVRGMALYEMMTSEQLVTSEGSGFVRWHPDKPVFLERDGVEWVTVDPVTEAKTPVFSPQQSKGLIDAYNQITGESLSNLPFRQFDFVLNSDGIQFSNNDRHFLYTLSSGSMRELKRPEVVQQPFTDGLMRNMPGSQLWNGEYSPDFNYFAFVRDYDLYLVDTRTGAETRITTDGNENTFNGRPNWVYPEEFSQDKAYWFSPDSKKLAYYRSDESGVHKFPLVHDLVFEAEIEFQSYPKAGEPNPVVELFVYSIADQGIVKVDTDSSPDTYIIRPEWTLDSSELTFRRMNRQQNELELLAANPTSGTVRTILAEKEPAFLNVQDDFKLLKDGERFIWSDETSGWRHIAIGKLAGGDLKYLTAGEWPVDDVTCIDEKNGWIYFSGGDGKGLDMQFFRVKSDGTGLKQLTTGSGTHRVSMDATCSFFVDRHSSFEMASNAALYKADGVKVRTLMTSNTTELDKLGLEQPELVTFMAADGKTPLHGVLYKPAGFDPNTAYPLLVSVYGGPHTKSVSNSYLNSGGLQALAQLGYMVWVADNRGLRRRGKAFESATYLKLGQIDLDDQTEGVKEVTKRAYVDGNRVGVFGHSYGGYMSAMALLRKPDIFHVGVAGAPVTDWRNYDTIYTERYMSTPQLNLDGYVTGSTGPYAKDLEGKLLLIHGTIDNNVHPGNTNQLINQLVEAGKDFDLMMYPDNRHGIRGASGRHYNRIRMEYFEKHLGPQPVGGATGTE